MLLGGAVNGEREAELEYEGCWVGGWAYSGTEDGRLSSISIKGTEYISSVLNKLQNELKKITHDKRKIVSTRMVPWLSKGNPVVTSN